MTYLNEYLVKMICMYVADKRWYILFWLTLVIFSNIYIYIAQNAFHSFTNRNMYIQYSSKYSGRKVAIIGGSTYSLEW